MTVTLRFRVDDALAFALDREAERSGVARTELLRQATRELLYRLRCERDAAIYAAMPLTADEQVEPGAGAWPDADDGSDWDEVFGR